MNNIELQNYCDVKKYERGFINNCDNSGMMQWCNHCEYQKSGRYGCLKTHEERKENCLCAIAYNKMESKHKN